MSNNRSNSPLPISRRRGLVVQEVRDELLVYDLETDRAHCLNETAAAIWRACDGKKSVPEIASAVRLWVGEHVSDDVIWLAIDDLAEHRLLEGKIDKRFDRISRREVIRRLGVASIAALPVIATLSAPKSVYAASSCACLDVRDCALQVGCGPFCGSFTGLCRFTL